MNWYVQAFRKYSEFNGRASRSEYWYFVLINALVIMGFILLDLLFTSYGILSIVYCVAAIIPAFAVTVRRLHDTNRSGWNILLGLIPIIGGIIVLVFLLQESSFGENRYGGYPE
jgi:uncharacterized membrane protein YhaH (DUF805 family)